MNTDELRAQARLAAQADTASVLQKLGEPLYPWRNGFLHQNFPDVWIQDGGWIASPGNKSYDRGNAVHFLMAFRGYTFQEAVSHVCAAAFPDYSAPGSAPRKSPAKAVLQMRRKQTLENLAAGIDDMLISEDKGVRLPPRTDDPESVAKVLRNLETVCGLQPDICDYVLESGKMYACRETAVFPGTDDQGRGFFYYALNARTGAGKIGCRAAANTCYPWHLEGTESRRLHVFPDPPHALLWLGERKQAAGMKEARSHHVMALCDEEPFPIYAYLARRLETEAVTLHFDDSEIVRQLKKTLGSVIEIESNVN